jgi:hypothetical protein
VATKKLRYVLDRLRGLLRPPITVRPAPTAEAVFEGDVAVRGAYGAASGSSFRS